MTCAACGSERGPFYRGNAKGEPAKWVCLECLDEPPDPKLKKIVDALSPPKVNA